MIELPHSEACVRNRQPILLNLKPFFADRRRVLEIGSGTGQHAVHFASSLTHLVWQSADRQDYLPGLAARIAQSGLDNLPTPIELDVMQPLWPREDFDAVFSANTLHIMAWNEVETLFQRLALILGATAKLAIYGPFKMHGRFTSASNQAFDASLKMRDSRMAVRDLEAVDALALQSGFQLQQNLDMPANNQLLFWQRR